MPLPDCCTCDFCYHACCDSFCSCCPAECEYGCFKCMFDFFGFIYCFSKLLGCILYGPYKFIKSLLGWLCCGFRFFLLLLAGLLALFAFLYRTFCSDISNFFDIVFVSGFGLGLLRFAISSAGDAWNTFAPRINTIIEIIGDMPKGIEEIFNHRLGTVGANALMNELSTNRIIWEKLIAGGIIGLLLSDPSRLDIIAEETPQLLQLLVDDAYERLNEPKSGISDNFSEQNYFGDYRYIYEKWGDKAQGIVDTLEAINKYSRGNRESTKTGQRNLLETRRDTKDASSGAVKDFLIGNDTDIRG